MENATVTGADINVVFSDSKCGGTLSLKKKKTQRRKEMNTEYEPPSPLPPPPGRGLATIPTQQHSPKVEEQKTEKRERKSYVVVLLNR